MFTPHLCAKIDTATVISRSDVDLSFVENTLVALVRTAEGWQTLQMTPEGALLPACRFAGRAWFSFDKRVVLTWINGATSRLEVVDPLRCDVRASLQTEGHTRDADVSLKAQRFAVARRTEHGLALALFDFSSNLILELGRIRNAELGFSSDGARLINLDHGGGDAALWRADDGTQVSSPFGTGVDHHFSADGLWAFTTSPGRVSRLRWPDVLGNPNETGRNEENGVRTMEVLRGVSAHGNSLLLQAPNPARPPHPSVRLLDTVTGRSFGMGAGHIDATALDDAGTQTAIAIRAERSNAVTITRVRSPGRFTP